MRLALRGDKSCVCYKLLAWLWRGVKSLLGYAAYHPLHPLCAAEAVLIMLGCCWVEFIFIASIRKHVVVI